MKASRRATRGGPRKIDQDDVESWLEAAARRPPDMTVERLRDHMHRTNFVRWRRLQKDFKWMMHEMKKLGLDPEEARWLP